VRQRRLQQQLDEGRFEPASIAWIAGLTLGGMTLALVTLVLVIVQP
jgi:hypothetical protein